MRDAFLMTVQDAPPLGEVVFAPAAVTGKSEAQSAHSMAQYLLARAPDTGAEALKLLRRAYPDAPLPVRVAALAALSRR